MKKHLTETKDLEKSEIISIFQKAEQYLDEKKRDILKGKVVINIFSRFNKYSSFPRWMRSFSLK